LLDSLLQEMNDHADTVIRKFRLGSFVQETKDLTSHHSTFYIVT